MVSSHAPVRGHLSLYFITGIRRNVSSHAPVRGHLIKNFHRLKIMCFKSCPREGASALPHLPSLVLTVFQVMPP